MIKRISLVWKRDELTSGEFAAIWLGEHADIARQLPRLREYVIDIVDQPANGEPDGIATTRFDSREDCDAAFGTPEFAEPLERTRNEFAKQVSVVFVEENVVHRAAVTR
jgi:uncharacterized protein (TIGR02118 family)